MDRRSFLKAAGVAPFGLATLSLPMMPRRVTAAEELPGSFRCNLPVSKAKPINGVDYFASLTGEGRFSLNSVEGSGRWALFDTAAKPSLDVLGSGEWVARRIVNFVPYGITGTLSAATVDIEIDLIKGAGAARTVIPARLRASCSVAAVNQGVPWTGMPCGFLLAIPGTPFIPEGAGGPFVPLESPTGTVPIARGAEVAAFDRSWEAEFRALHGRDPAPEDRGGRLWSLDFEQQHGRPPNDDEWRARWEATQDWIVHNTDLRRLAATHCPPGTGT